MTLRSLLAVMLVAGLGPACRAAEAESTETPAKRATADDPEPVEPLPEGLEFKVSEYVGQFGRHWPAFRFHGAILVARGSDVGLATGFGQSSLVDARDNAAPTRFRIGTLSAPITAAVVLRLVERGELSLDDRVVDRVPELQHGGEITVEQLLTHTSGLPSFTDSVVFGVWKRADHPAQETLQLVAELEPEVEPGSQVWPSNTNYLLLGLVAERVTRRPFATLARELVLEPAKMNDTTWGDGDQPVARGMQFADDESLDVVRDVDARAFGAAGAFVSTVGDLHRFVHALHDGTLLTEESVARLFGRTPEDPGYGFVPDIRFGRRVLTWPGLIDGFNGTMVHFPQDDTTVIVLANSEVVPTALVAEQVAGLVYGEPTRTWEEPRPAPVPVDDQLSIVGTWALTDGSRDELATFADPEALSELAKIRVVRDADHLVLDVPGHARRRMHPLAAGRWFFKDVGGTRAELSIGADGTPRLALHQRTGPTMRFRPSEA